MVNCHIAINFISAEAGNSNLTPVSKVNQKESCLLRSIQVQFKCCYNIDFRGVAQPGSALAWGARGRVFESHRPDQKYI